MSDNPAAASPLVMPFGKHKGKPITQLPTSYLKWAAENGTSLPGEIKHEIVEILKTRGTKSSGPREEPPWSQSDPAPADQQEQPTRRDEKREQYNDEPRKPFKVSEKGRFVKVNGCIIGYEEFRSIREVRTPVQKDDCVLTHVATVKLGCMGDGPSAPTKVWLTQEEAVAIEEMLFTKH